jgi:hypothetical protein
MPEHERGSNGWSRYEEMVLDRLERLQDQQDAQGRKIDEIRTEDLPLLRVHLAKDMATVKSEMRHNAQMWALLAGAIPIILGVIYAFLGRNS